MRISNASMVCCLLIAVLTGPAVADSERMRKVTEIEGISEYQLENGLKVLLFSDVSKPTVTVNLTVFVGSRHEGYGEAGMAHLLEHMLFKGTPQHPNVPKVLQARGAQFNGTTWVDRTNYYATLPAAGDNLEFVIRLEADRMVNSFVKAEDLASEMTVVRNEFERGENSPYSVLSRRMMSAAFQWHNYGKATIGNRADIERVPVERLRAFYRKYYQPDNAMLVVAGKFESKQALVHVEKYFGAIPRPERTLETTYTEEPAQDGERVVTLRRVGDVALVGVLYHMVSGPHPDYASLDVLESIFTAAPAGRLYKGLVEAKKAAQVYGVAYAWHDPGAIRFMAEVAAGNEPQAALDSMLDIIESVAETEVTAVEIERAKQRLLKQRELDAADSRRIAVELSEWAAQGDWRLYFLYRDRIEQVTSESVRRVAAKYLRRNNRTVGLYLPAETPERVAVPPTPDLAKMIGEYQGRGGIAAGEAFDVSVANIEARTQRLTLPGGINAALLPKKTRGETVNLRLVLRYGSDESLQGLATACEYLPRLMTRGTRQLARQQLQDALDKNRTRLSAQGSAGEATFTLQTKREHLMAALDLLRQVLREPTLPDAELEIVKSGRVATLEQQRNDPNARCVRAVRRHLYPYEKADPRYVPTVVEEIALVKGLTPSTLRHLYGFLGNGAGELVIVGDFDLEQALLTIQDILADWTAQQSYDRLRYYVNSKFQGSTESIRTPDKANAMYFAATAIPLRDDDPAYPALAIGNFIFGGGSLSSRLGDRVRQKEGLSYGVGSQFQARSLDPRAALSIYAICNPANMEKVKIAIGEELGRLLKSGVTEAELEEAKQAYLQRQEVARSTDTQLARILAQSMHANRTLQYVADLERKIQTITPRHVADAMRRHIDPKKLILVTAGDFPELPPPSKPAK